MPSYIFDYEQYKSRINNKKNFSFVIVFFLIITLLFISIIIWPNAINSTKFYFLEIDSFSTFSEASNLASDIKSKGGAGYIYYDTKYHVFANIYLTKNDAKSVLENIKNEYKNSKIYILSTKKYRKNTDFSNETLNFLKKTIKNNLETIDRLNEISINFDKGELNETSTKTALISVKEFFLNGLNDINIKDLKMTYLNKIYDTITYAENEISSANLKKALIQIALYHSFFISCW